MELEVIQLKATRIHVPATKLETATEVGIVANAENFCWPEVKEVSYPIGFCELLTAGLNPNVRVHLSDAISKKNFFGSLIQ